MNGYLLDTHIWIWSLLVPENLSREVKEVLGNENNELWLSSVSVWETLKLIEKKKIKVTIDKSKWIAAALSLDIVNEAPLTHAIAIESTLWKSDHKDPADLFIAATAKVYDLTLITSDLVLSRLKEIKCLINK